MIDNIIWILILFGGISLISYIKDFNKKQKQRDNANGDERQRHFGAHHKASAPKEKLEDKTQDDVYKKYDDFFDDYDKKYK